ncbi:hypothetical protein ACP3P6_20770 [Enterobacter mori]
MPFAPLRTVAHSAIHDRVEYTPSENPRMSEYVSWVTGTLIGLENRLNALDAKGETVIRAPPLRKVRGILRSVWRSTNFR